MTTGIEWEDAAERDADSEEKYAIIIWSRVRQRHIGVSRPTSRKSFRDSGRAKKCARSTKGERPTASSRDQDGNRRTRSLHTHLTSKLQSNRPPQKCEEEKK